MSYIPKWIDRRHEILGHAQLVKAHFPDAWEELKIQDQPSRRFINLVSAACIDAGIPAGVNLKRGGPLQSIDALAFPNLTGAPDSTGKYPGLEIIDIVAGAEGPNPRIEWIDVTQATLDKGESGGWMAGDPNGVEPEPEPPPFPPYPGDHVFDAVGVALFADYAQAGNAPDPQMGRWFGRTIYDWLAQHTPTLEASIAKHRAEWRAALGLPPL